MPRPAVPFLDTRASAPAVAAGASPGTQRFILSEDPQTGAHTFLIRLPPGWRGLNTRPDRLQFHTHDEEMFILEGNVIADEWHVYEAGCYYYRPAWVLHGFGDNSPKGCFAIAKLTSALDQPIIFMPVPPGEIWRGVERYHAELKPQFRSPRQNVDYLDTNAMAWDTLNSGALLKRLSHDPATLATSWLMRLPAGWEGSVPRDLPHANETYVIEGSLEIEGAPAVFRAGCYQYQPPDWSPEHRERSPEGCLAIRWSRA